MWEGKMPLPHLSRNLRYELEWYPPLEPWTVKGDRHWFQIRLSEHLCKCNCKAYWEHWGNQKAERAIPEQKELIQNLICAIWCGPRAGCV